MDIDIEGSWGNGLTQTPPKETATRYVGFEDRYSLNAKPLTLQDVGGPKADLPTLLCMSLRSAHASSLLFGPTAVPIGF